MSARTDLLSAMTSSTVGGAKLQSYLRDFIEEGRRSMFDDKTISEEIALLVTEFRRDTEGWINAAPDDEAVNTRRKQANNVVNDVARNCRKVLGYTIQCSSRKDHIYKSRDYIKRTPKPPTKAPSAPITPPDPDIKSITNDEFFNYAKSYPYLAAEAFVKAQKDLSSAATLIASTIRSIQSKEEES